MTEKKKNGSGGKTRREFLKDAGLLVGGTAIGSTVLLAACGGGETETVTDTVTRTNTVTSTAPGTTQTVTSTTTVGAGQTATVTDTVTTTQTQTESKFICPIDNMEFDTLAELQAHFTATHPEKAAGFVTLNVNGVDHGLFVEDHESVAHTLREQLNLTGTKIGCDMGQCGACTILADGVPVFACLMLSCEAEGIQITTVEGLSDGVTLSPVQQKMYDNEAPQCGYCTPGFVMAAQGLLNVNPTPTEDDVRLAFSGHICMCQAFKKHIDAVVGGV